MFNFEKLEVWREAIEFARLIYALTSSFPEAERYGLTSQMRRAAVSVSSNIAEGSSRSLRQDFARFVEIAAGSVFEVTSQATLASRLHLVTDTDLQTVQAAAEQLCRMLSGLRRSLLNS